MEKRTGVIFPLELKQYMEPRRQQSAKNIKPGMWHCYDIAFLLICGDIDTATQIYGHLKKFNSEFKEQLQIAIPD